MDLYATDAVSYIVTFQLTKKEKKASCINSTIRSPDVIVVNIQLF